MSVGFLQAVNYSSTQDPTTVTAAFLSGITSGSRLVVGVAWNGNSRTISSVTDSGGTTYSLIANIQDSGAAANASIYAGTGPASGANTVSIVFSVGTLNYGIGLYEISNSTSGQTNSVGSGTTAAISVPSFTAYTNGITIAMIGTPAGLGGGWGSAGTNFTQVAHGSSAYGETEYSTTVAGATTAPFNGSSSLAWQEVAVSFQPVATTAVFAESGPKRQYRRGERQR